MSRQPYRIDSAAMMVTKRTADSLTENNMTVAFTKASNPVNPRETSVCTIIKAHDHTENNVDFDSYQDFAEKHFAGDDADKSNGYFCLGVLSLADGSLVPVDKKTAWSNTDSVGIIYIHERDVFQNFVDTGKNIVVAGFGQVLTNLANTAMEKEIALYSAYENNLIHDVTVSTNLGSVSHTIENVYALAPLSDNKTHQPNDANHSLVDSAVIFARDAVLDKIPY